MRHNIPAAELSTLTLQLHRLHHPPSVLEAANALTQTLRANQPTCTLLWIRRALLWVGLVLFVVLIISNTMILVSAGSQLPPLIAVVAGLFLLALSVWAASALWVCIGAAFLVSRWPGQTWAIIALTYSHVVTATSPDPSWTLKASTILSLLIVGAVAVHSMGPDTARRLPPCRTEPGQERYL